MVNLLSWLKRKKKANTKKKKRSLQEATVGRHVASGSRHVGDTLGDIYRQLNELTILLSKHDNFLREDHHKKGLIQLAKFISENFYRLSTAQQNRVRQKLEFIRTDEYIIAALAKSRRLRVVELLAILKKNDIKNRQYVSERVNRMVEAGVVERERVGKRIYYSKINPIGNPPP